MGRFFSLFVCLFVCFFRHDDFFFSPRGWAKLRQGGGEGERMPDQATVCVCLTGAPCMDRNGCVVLLRLSGCLPLARFCKKLF